jgi:hypothetical protein
MMAQLAVTGKKWCDFVSFDPRLPEHLRLFVVRFQPTQEAITDLENKVRDFLNETQTAISKLEQK